MGEGSLEREFRRYRARGDVEALGTVFDAVAPELARLARHLVGRAAEAEDLVQSTFLTAIEKAADFDAERRLVPWLVGILAGHAANARRKAARERWPGATPPAVLGDVPGKQPDAARAAEERELYQQLERAVDDLPPSYREVLAAHLFEGKGASSLAAELGLSAGAVRLRLHRGLKALRAALPAGVAAAAEAPTASAFTDAALAAARSAVLASARAGTPALATDAAPLAAASLWIGGLYVSQRILFSAALAAVLLTSAMLWRSVTAPEEATSSAAGLGSARHPALTGVPPAEPRADAEPIAESAPVTVERQELVIEGGTAFRGIVRDASTQEPIEGAMVFTTPEGASSPALKATSDEGGEFSFRAQVSEEASLRIEAPGFALWTQPISAERRERLWMLSGRRELSEDGEIDLGRLELLPGVSFAGRSLWAADRSPAAGVELVLLFDEFSFVTLEERVVGRSLADGTLAFDGELPALASGVTPYMLLALHPRGFGWTYVTPGAEGRTIDGVEVLLEPCFELEVQVLDAAGAGTGDLVVRCTPLLAPFPGRMPSELDEFFPAPPALASVLEARTDAGGVARFERLPPAPARNPSGYAFASAVEVLRDGEVLLRERIHLRQGRPARAVLTLRPDAGLWISGRVLDEHGRPLVGAGVRSDSLSRGAETDADGRYRIERRASDPEVIELRAFAPGLVDDRLSVNFAMRSARLDGNDFRLLPPLAIAGRLEDGTGRPIAGVPVWAYRELGKGHIAGAHTGSATDEQGRFLIPDAAAGEWRLWPVLGERMRSFRVPDEGFAARGGDRDVRIVLEGKPSANASLEVALVDASSGDPVDAVRAQLFHVGEQGMLASPRLGAGKVVFESLAPGRYDLWVATGDRRLGQATIEVDGSTPRTFASLSIGAGGRLVGRVDLSRVGSLPERSQVLGTRVSASGIHPGGGAFEGADAKWVRAEVDARGGFSAEALMPGPWSFRLDALGATAAVVEAEIVPQRELCIRLEAEVAAVLELVPERSPGIGWMIVELRAADGPWEQKGMSHLVEEIPPFPHPLTVTPGLVRWRARFESGFGPDAQSLALPQEGALEISAGERRRVDVRVEPSDR